MLPVSGAQRPVQRLLRSTRSCASRYRGPFFLPNVLERIETCGDRPRILISHSRHVVSSFILVHLLHAQVAVELLSFYVNKSLSVRGDIMLSTSAASWAL